MTWLLVEGLPMILAAIFSCSAISLILYLWFSRSTRTQSQLSTIEASNLQNRVYKRAGALLLILGAAGGFLPSVLILANTGHVWSVNQQAPHSMVDTYLLIHIPLAVIWACLVAVQLWSGQVLKRRRLHMTLGWITLATGIVGIGIVGGWLWPLVNDFANGFDSPNAGAGIYTMSMGLGVVVNGLMAGYFAHKRDLARHKDHALMALFWTMDPGLHRLNMWLMRWFGGDTWSPEQTGGLGIAIAKLPANLTLIAWALTMAILARRLNGIIWSNVAGQFILWTLGTSAAMAAFYSQQLSVSVLGLCSVLFLTAWGIHRFKNERVA